MEQDTSHSSSTLSPLSGSATTGNPFPTVFCERTLHNELTYRFIDRVENRRVVRVVNEHDPGNSRMAFSGTWTFDLLPYGTPATPEHELQLQDLWHSAHEDEEECVLQLTERGVVRRPIARFFGFFIFGYHRTVDRFLKDIKEEVERERDDREAEKERKGKAAPARVQAEPVVVPEDEKVTVKPVEIIEAVAVKEELEEITTRLLLEEVEKAELKSEAETQTEGVGQGLMEGSEYADMEWDTVSEIYDRKA
ncbi:hypothetical protein BC936DRAFT_144280 [Jimgerdemannia flammicorona]|uniref:Uncharacterized protein n=1 Tax=Jimgerdemannia flammicorona TaxID=994334 RepID=A0A432ZY34_9FUNG|nr:hypothetical protein BC936DRAFT_144280 [Jimgerdemannia flammicorona]